MAIKYADKPKAEIEKVVVGKAGKAGNSGKRRNKQVAVSVASVKAGKSK